MREILSTEKSAGELTKEQEQKIVELRNEKIKIEESKEFQIAKGYEITRNPEERERLEQIKFNPKEKISAEDRMKIEAVDKYDTYVRAGGKDVENAFKLIGNIDRNISEIKEDINKRNQSFEESERKIKEEFGNKSPEQDAVVDAFIKEERKKHDEQIEIMQERMRTEQSIRNSEIKVTVSRAGPAGGEIDTAIIQNFYGYDAERTLDAASRVENEHKEKLDDTWRLSQKRRNRELESLKTEAESKLYFERENKKDYEQTKQRVEEERRRLEEMRESRLQEKKSGVDEIIRENIESKKDIPVIKESEKREKLREEVQETLEGKRKTPEPKVERTDEEIGRRRKEQESFFEKRKKKKEEKED